MGWFLKIFLDQTDLSTFKCADQDRKLKLKDVSNFSSMILAVLVSLGLKGKVGCGSREGRRGVVSTTSRRETGRGESDQSARALHLSFCCDI